MRCSMAYGEANIIQSRLIKPTYVANDEETYFTQKQIEQLSEGCIQATEKTKSVQLLNK